MNGCVRNRSRPTSAADSSFAGIRVSVIGASDRVTGGDDTRRAASVGADAGLRVELLEQVVGGQLDLLVAPLRGPEHAGDQAAPMKAPEVAEDERVAGLGLVGGPGGQPEVPRGVFVPLVLVEEVVLVRGGRLRLVPLAIEDVLAGGDQLASLLDGRAVQVVSGHRGIVARRWSPSSRRTRSAGVGVVSGR